MFGGMCQVRRSRGGDVESRKGTRTSGIADKTPAAQWIEPTGEVGQNLETLKAYNIVYTKL